jgi:hypothetical protein
MFAFLLRQKMSSAGSSESDVTALAVMARKFSPIPLATTVTPVANKPIALR